MQSQSTYAIDRGFIAANGRAALRARSIVASLPRMAEPLCLRLIVASLPRMAELLCLHDRLWICCRGWPRPRYAWIYCLYDTAFDRTFELFARKLTGRYIWLCV